MAIATGGITNGVTKYVAQYINSPKKLNNYLSSSFLITLLLSLLTEVILIMFSNYFASIILLSNSYSYIFIIFGITIFFYSLNNLILSILNGLKEYKKFVIINIISSILGALFTIILVNIYKLKGALIAAVTFQSFTFFITYLIVHKLAWAKTINLFSYFSVSAAKKYLNYSLMTLVSLLLVPISQLLIRSYIFDNLSPLHAGLWEAMSRLSGVYLLVITTSLSVYYLPKLSELNSNLDMGAEIKSTIKFLTPFLALLFISIFILKGKIILLLFSNTFNDMLPLFKYQLIGDFFKIISWLISFIMVAKSMTKLYIITEILFTFLYLILSYFLFKKNGIIGLSVAYMINYILFLFYILYIFREIIFNNLKKIY